MTPAERLRAAAELARETHHPFYVTVAGWLEAQAEAIDFWGLDQHEGLVIDGGGHVRAEWQHGLLVADTLLAEDRFTAEGNVHDSPSLDNPDPATAP